jgi:hypothetical protein
LLLRIVLRIQGEQLASKSSQRIVWWSTKRWYSVIYIIPELTKTQPLWCRSNESLASVRLFGLTPQQLQEKVQRYWQKPTWRRWLLRLFNSIINQQVKAWSYYQQCLAFREIQDQNPVTESDLVVAKPAELLIDKLGHWFSQQERGFHHVFEKQSVRGPKKHFESDLNYYEKERKKKFLKQLKKELKSLPSECNQEEVKKQAQAAYQDMEGTMRDYLLLWHGNLYSAPTHKASTQERRVELHTGPSTESRQTRSPVTMDLQCEDKGISSTNVQGWVSGKRQAMNRLLACKPLPEKAVQQLLEGSFTTLTAFIELQLSFYQQRIKEVMSGKIDYKPALQIIQRLQSSFILMYRQGALLFHPDHYQEVSGVLARHWQEIFMNYKSHVDVVMLQLNVEETKLQRYLGPWLELDKRIEAFRKFYQENELERQAFRKSMEESYKRMEEKIREQEEQFKEQIEQLRAEMKEKAKVQEEREKVQEDKINKLTQLVEQLVARSPEGDRVSAESAANEGDQSTQRFFKP